MTLQLIRKDDVVKITSLPKTTLDRRVKAGVFPPQVKLGGFTSGWFEHEIDAIIAAWATGQTEDQQKALVVQLIEDRKNLSVRNLS